MVATRQAGDSENEIEVTPDTVEAAAWRLWELSDGDGGAAQPISIEEARYRIDQILRELRPQKAEVSGL